MEEDFLDLSGSYSIQQPIQNTTTTDQQDLILDKQWAHRAFLLPDSQLSDTYDIQNRYWSSASVKFTDTRMGGNIGVNSRPQFNRYSDIRVKGRLADRSDVSIAMTGGNYGMGRYYSEAIDDNSQTIYIRAGVPQFNSMMNFFSKAFDGSAATLARTGRAKSAVYKITETFGAIAMATTIPVIALSIYAARTLNHFFGSSNSKFYTLKPSMHLYWSAVSALVNTIAINKGIMPRLLESGTNDQQINTMFKLDPEHMDLLHQMMPEMFSADRYIDVFSAANKAQRMANALFMEDFEKLDRGSASDFLGVVKKSYQDKRTQPNGDLPGFLEYIKTYLSFSYWFSDDVKDASTLEIDPKIDKATGQPAKPKDSNSFLKHLDAEYNSGSQFAVFKVAHTGAINDSFSNAIGDSELSSKFNSAASAAREMRFNLSGGNIGDGVIFNAIEGATQLVTEAVAGTLSGVTAGLSNVIINGLIGGSYMDIPKNYKSSTASLGKTSYKIHLTSPYANPISQMQNIYIPLAMLMALVLPLSTGKQSYTSPFLVQVFDRGRQQIQLGMVESLSISRGEGNLGFTRKGNAIAIDVTLTITDMSSIMHMPISQGKLFENDVAMDSDNILQDYLALLAGQGIYDQLYVLPKAKLKFAKTLRSFSKLTSPAYWASFVHEELTTNSLVTLFTLGGNKLYDAVVPGSDIVTK